MLLRVTWCFDSFFRIKIKLNESSVTREEWPAWKITVRLLAKKGYYECYAPLAGIVNLPAPTPSFARHQLGCLFKGGWFLLPMSTRFLAHYWFLFLHDVDVSRNNSYILQKYIILRYIIFILHYYFILFYATIYYTVTYYLYYISPLRRSFYKIFSADRRIFQAISIYIYMYTAFTVSVADIPKVFQ